MKIVILTGGTGSIALQRGLYNALDANVDGIDTKVVVNAYDNGLSTGAVRQVMKGQILGPSDVRKNQATRLRLMDPNSPWLNFMDFRFTAETADARKMCLEQITTLLKDLARQGRNVACREQLLGAVDVFFNSAAASTIEYHDFSVSNIVYAGLSRANANSMRAAARIMSEAMRIPDNVLLNDDNSLFLGAITQSGRRIQDEAEIVAWGSNTDPIVDVFFVDANGNESLPTLCLEAWQAIVEADLIILSSGTQWSSLIPTYASIGFTAAIRDSKAKILMVMNRVPDKDSPSLSASDIIDALVPRFFDVGRLHVLIDSNGHPRMRALEQRAMAKIASLTQCELSGHSDPAEKHNPDKLAAAIGHVFFKEYTDSRLLLFDYDDTLFGRANRFPKSSRFNINGIHRLNGLADIGICTGNTIKALDLGYQPVPSMKVNGFSHKPLHVFADGGINEYLYDNDLKSQNNGLPELVKCISPEAMLPQAGAHCCREVIDALKRAGIPESKIENRGNVLIAIRPLDPSIRQAVVSLARNIVRDSGLEVRESGTTTVEIYNPALSKIHALKYLCKEYSDLPKITYVGDECDSGNDYEVKEFSTKEPRIKCLQVDSPAKTAFFIYTLIANLENNAQH